MPNSDLFQVIKAHGPIGEDYWTFKRCLVNTTTYHSEVYKKVTVRNNYTVHLKSSSFSGFASIIRFFKVCEPCRNASCTLQLECTCNQEAHYYAVVRLLERNHDVVMPTINKNEISDHIIPIMETNR